MRESKREREKERMFVHSCFMVLIHVILWPSSGRERDCVGVCVCVCVYAHICVYVNACVHVCVRLCVAYILCVRLCFAYMYIHEFDACV